MMEVFKDRGAAELPSADALFRLLFEEVPCYCSILDKDLNIIAANRLCRENFTTPFSRRCFQVFKGRKEACDDCPATSSLRDGCVSESVEVLTERSGREVDVICRTLPIRNDKGKITGVLHMSLRAGPADKLQQAMTSFDSQVGAVSHGIKGLLTAMVGGFYMWDSGLAKNKPDRLQKGIGVVRRNFHRLQHLAHHVLYYVRDRRLHLEEVDGVELLTKIMKDMEEDWSFAGARFVLEERPDALTLTADRRALESALVNLVVSSLEDCRIDKRDIDHEVRLALKREKDHAVFEVKDNGVGMDPDTVNKVFSLFFNPKGIEAAGVGLFIANKLVRAHKGGVEIESERNRGTRYRLRVPLEQ